MSDMYKSNKATSPFKNHFLFLFPILGNLLLTAALTLAFSLGEPCCATLANAFLACALSCIGYLPLTPLAVLLFPVLLGGNANLLLVNLLLPLVVILAISYNRILFL